MVTAVLLICLAVFFFWPRPEKLPNPNGYDDLAKAGELLSKTGADPGTMNIAKLSAFFKTNQEALRLIDLGLSRECRVPPFKSQAEMWAVDRGDYFVFLTAALRGAGRLAFFEKRTNDAARFYLEMIELGGKWCRGSTVTSKYQCFASEKQGEHDLKSLTNALPASFCREACQKLESLDAEEESPSTIWWRTYKFTVKFSTMKYKIVYWFHALTRRASQSKKDFFKECDSNTRARRQWMLALAARAYTLERGKPPADAAALVPEYLKQVPKDPATGQKLALQP